MCEISLGVLCVRHISERVRTKLDFINYSLIVAKTVIVDILILPLCHTSRDLAQNLMCHTSQKTPLKIFFCDIFLFSAVMLLEQYKRQKTFSALYITPKIRIFLQSGTAYSAIFQVDDLTPF